jgi:lipase maturation factor 1
MAAVRRWLVWAFDGRSGGADRLIARWLFLRALGLIYFSAFFALIFQVRGLVGAAGVMPAGEFLDRLRGLGAERFWVAPTVLWWVHGDRALMAVIWAGLIASLLVVVDLAPRWSLLVCFVCFLSFIGVSQDFGQYQSDGMLLEAGLLSLFLAPRGLWPGWGRESPPSRAALFLLLWEWFRIYFESGVVKLASGDPTWRNLTAMYEYYQNGPLPTWVGWYLQHLPHWFHIATAGLTLVMELVFVWMALLPRPWKVALAVIVTVWQAGVIATANYAFLNYLVLVLGVLLLDDDTLRRWVPARWRLGSKPVAPPPRRGLGWLPFAVSVVVLTWVGYVTTAGLVTMLWPGAPLPETPVRALEPFRVANTYGLFANMTPHRYEVEFQGSNDGQNWTAYPFRYKPQNLAERPRIYAPYQPRFDWNLWFASLTSWQEAPIVPLTEERLLAGSPDVLGLFAGDPFGGHPPRYVRAVLWQYWFSSPAEKDLGGVWWRRQLLGTYAPTVERLPDGRYGIVAEPQLDGPPGP